MDKWIASAAGGTSQRLKFAPAVMCSFDKKLVMLPPKFYILLLLCKQPCILPHVVISYHNMKQSELESTLKVKTLVCRLSPLFHLTPAKTLNGSQGRIASYAHADPVCTRQVGDVGLND